MKPRETRRSSAVGASGHVPSQSARESTVESCVSESKKASSQYTKELLEMIIQ